MNKKYRDILDKYKLSERNDLIPLLQEIQHSIGFIPEEAIKDISTLLNISATKVYGMASFYDGFRFSPRGRIHIRICNGTSCFIKRPFDIQAVLAGELKIDNAANRSANGTYSIEMVDCLGACHLGPLVAVNSEFFTVNSEQELRQLIHKIKSDDHS